MNGRMGVYPAESGNPVIGRMLSPDKIVQAPGYTQSYNRYSYCMNNPLRYTDPSGWYTMRGQDFSGVYPDFLDRIYGSSGGGAFALGGGGGGGGSHYNWATGDYVINGEVVSYWQVHNNYIVPMASYKFSGPDARALIRRAMDGFSLYSYNLNGRENLVLSIGDPKLVAKIDGDGGYIALNQTAGSYLYGTLAIGQLSKSFEGVSVYENSLLGFGAAFTIPGIGITVSDGIYKYKDFKGSYGRQVLMHEFGHILQNKYYGNIASVIISPRSLYSATFSKNTIEHQNTWTEIQANTLSYLYFQQPSYWDFNEFPINLDYVSPQIINSLTSNKR